MTQFEDLSKKLGLLEIATLKKYPKSRKRIKRNGKIKITGVDYIAAYAERLERAHPFNDINWAETPFSEFAIFKDEPPRKLAERNGDLVFVDIGTVESWKIFIDSFRQLRNNLAHSAKFLKGMDLKPRDHELIEAGLAFIGFLESKGLIDLQNRLPQKAGRDTY